MTISECTKVLDDMLDDNFIFNRHVRRVTTKTKRVVALESSIVPILYAAQYGEQI